MALRAPELREYKFPASLKVRSARGRDRDSLANRKTLFRTREHDWVPRNEVLVVVGKARALAQTDFSHLTEYQWGGPCPFAREAIWVSCRRIAGCAGVSRLELGPSVGQPGFRDIPEAS